MNASLITKIRKFKITPKSQGVLRQLKNLHGLKSTEQLEEQVSHAIRDAQRCLTPAAVYTTFTPQQTPALPQGLGDWNPKEVARTLAVVTIGEGLEEECRKAVARSEVVQNQILESLGQDGLQQGVQFVCRLIEEQARAEEAEFDAPEILTGEAIAAALETLEAGRVGVTGQDGVFHPRFTSAFLLRWRAQTRRSKKPTSEQVRVAR